MGVSKGWGIPDSICYRQISIHKNNSSHLMNPRPRRFSFSASPVELTNPEEADIKNTLTLQTLVKVTRRPHDIRTSQQNTYLYNALKDLKYIQRLLEHTDKDTIKSLLKPSRIIHLSQGEILFSSMNKSEYFYILISGRVEITSLEQKALDDNLVDGLLFNMIYQFAPVKKKKPSTRSLRHKLDEKHSAASIRTRLDQKQHLIKLIEEQDCFLDDLYHVHNVKSYQARALSESYLVEIPINVHNSISKVYNERRSQWMKELMRKFRSFDFLQDKSLFHLIRESHEITKFKKETIYEEGGIPNAIYILKRGEVEISKKSGEGLEIPQLNNKQIENGLYSSPERKEEMITISILSQENLFGEEDITKPSNTTTARVLSSSATYYAIPLDRLEAVLKKQNYSLDDFNNYLELKTSRKRSYRLTRFSEVINIRKKYSSSQNTSRLQSPSYAQPPDNAMVLTRLLSINRVRRPRVESNEKQSLLDLSILQTRSKFQVYQQLSLIPNGNNRQMSASPPRVQNNSISLNNPLFDLNYFKEFQKECRRKVRDSHRRMETALNTTMSFSRNKKTLA